MRVGFLGGAEEEVLLHFVECGVVWVLHPNDTALPMVDTGEGAHLHPARVRDVGAGPSDGIVGTCGVFTPPPHLGARVGLVDLSLFTPLPLLLGFPLIASVSLPPPLGARGCFDGLGVLTPPPPPWS